MEQYYTLNNVFSRDIINLLYISCKKHLIYNVNSYDSIMFTNCIVDCHGLALSPKVVFPYDQHEWNIFCMKIKKIVSDYCDIIGKDKKLLVPHSCWVERSVNFHEKHPERVKLKGNVHYDGEYDKNIDQWLEDYLGCKCFMIRVIYYLKNSDPEYGTVLSKNNSFTTILGEENSLLIYPCGQFLASNKFPIDTEEKYNIIFDWYLHPTGTGKKPAWFLPDINSQKQFQDQIMDWWKS